MKKITIVILGMATAITLMSCKNETPAKAEASAHPLVSAIGKGCTVEFKKPTTATTPFNKPAAFLGGTLKAVREDGILILVEKRKLWIPMDSILLITWRR